MEHMFIYKEHITVYDTSAGNIIQKLQAPKVGFKLYSFYLLTKFELDQEY